MWTSHIQDKKYFCLSELIFNKPNAVNHHLQSRWWFPSQKAFKGIAF